MLSAHVNPVLQEQRYDAGQDFDITVTPLGPIIQPRTPDTAIVFGMLQHAINRVLRQLDHAPILENGWLDAATYAAITAIATTPTMITAAFFPWLTQLTPGLTYRDYVPLAVFRTEPAATGLITLAERARTWATVFRGLADARWYATTAATEPRRACPASTSATRRWPLVVAMLGGALVGVISTITLHGQRRA